MRESKIQYNPSLTVKENAKRNGVSEAAIRYYIKVHHLDRRFDRTQNLIADCRKYLKKHPNATKTELKKKTGHSLSTIRMYWEYITTEKELTNFDSQKKQKRQLRQLNNFYATHPSCTADILREEDFYKDVLEPFCGVGSMSDVIKQHGHNVLSYDIVDRGYGLVGDFYQVDFPRRKYDIITNPPYDNVIDVVLRCLDICKEKVAVLMPLRYLSSGSRYNELYKKCPPKRVYVYQERICIAKNADFEKYNDAGANMEIYAWYIWERGFKGTTELKWISNSKVSTKKESAPRRYEDVTILDGIPFKPFEEFKIPVKECIQFHSKALPENKVLSNHYDCIIRFRDCEFYSLEQMFMGLTYSDTKKILRDVMNSTSGIKAKKICREKYADMRDWDFEEKRYRIIALCHLYKYLSVKEYRDRLRATYPQTLVESPNGKDYHFGMVQNLETNIFEGNNCSGRTTMIVRDMMLQLENEAIQEREMSLGRTLTDVERENVVEEVCAKVREKYDTDKTVLKDSRQLFKFIEDENIPKIKKRRPTPMEMPIIDRSHRCLVLDFDMTIFDTSVDDAYRKCSGKKDLDKAFELIPEYKLYEGFREVFEWCKNNRTKIAILSGASKKLIETTFAHFKIPYDVIIGYQPYIEKPNPILGNMLMEKLNLREEQIVYVGDSLTDDTQARSSKFRFYGSTWSGRENDLFEAKGIPTISNPTDIIPILESIAIEEPSAIKPVEVIEPKPTKKKVKAEKKPKKINTTIRCTDKYAYFYQDTPLSNWWTSPLILHDGLSFLSSEGVFMYEKAKGMGDEEYALKIHQADTDTSLTEKERFSKVKKLGKKCKWDEAIYIEKREEWMYTALTAKYKVDKAFRDVLMAEEYRGLTFVEASPWDKIWGIKSRATQAILDNGEAAWQGLNLLGKLLTRLRDEMIEKSLDAK